MLQCLLSSWPACRKIWWLDQARKLMKIDLNVNVFSCKKFNVKRPCKLSSLCDIRGIFRQYSESGVRWKACVLYIYKLGYYSDLWIYRWYPYVHFERAQNSCNWGKVFQFIPRECVANWFRNTNLLFRTTYSICTTARTRAEFMLVVDSVYYVEE